MTNARGCQALLTVHIDADVAIDDYSSWHRNFEESLLELTFSRNLESLITHNSLLAMFWTASSLIAGIASQPFHPGRFFHS